MIAVHLFGQCATLDEIARICKEKNLLLIEDCAQCIGAGYDGKRAGSWGEFEGFSFYPTRNLAAAGDAGLITAKEKTYEETLRMLRHHGSRQTYLHERVGWNSRLDEPQAAVLRVKLKASAAVQRSVHHPRRAVRRDPRGTGEGRHRQLGVLAATAAPPACV